MGSDGPAGHWHFTLDADGAGALTPGMSLVRHTLDTITDHHGAGQRQEDVLLVACELLANACRHTPGPTRLDLDLDDGLLTVAVTDRSTALPVPRPWRPEAPHGHGLHIVDRLTTSWGLTPAAGGKTVWATMPAP